MPPATPTETTLCSAAGEADARRPDVALVAVGMDNPGGQGIQAKALVEGLEAEGHRVLFVPIDPAFPRGLRWLRRVPVLRTLLNQALYLPSLVRLRRVDVAHIFSASYWSFLLAPVPAMIAARMFGKRVVLNYHSGEADDHLANWGMRVHPFLRLAHELVVPSPYLKDVFERHGYRARVVRNVVDTSRFRFRERDPLEPKLLSTRNLEPHYRVDVILKAFRLVKMQHPGATLTVAGFGSEDERLRKLASELDVDGVRFAGRVDPESVPRLYDEAGVFVNASVVDNQPVSVLEAFASGTPVVSTPTGDIAYMVRDGETGRTVEADNPAALARAVCELLDDPDAAAALARRARREVDRYTWPEARKGWSEAYAPASA